jgi:hypothetical protein
MTVQKRDILGSNAVETPQSDLGSEGTHSPEPSSHGALGSEPAHGDVSHYDCANFGGVKNTSAQAICPS